jgi:hypothetical protein
MYAPKMDGELVFLLRWVVAVAIRTPVYQLSYSQPFK